jgi:MFS family permease
MIRSTASAARLLRAATPDRTKSRQTADASPVPTYGRTFWCAYISNLLITTANATLFRYGDFIALAGGTELVLGLIVGAGMIGSLLMRSAQGVGVDRYGVRRVWLLSNAGFVVSCLGHLFVHRASSPLVFVLRILYQTSVAGIFGSSIAFISRRSPVYRMAEVVGTLGTSGFLGMILGASLVDWLYGPGPVTADGVSRMFLAAGGLAALAGIFAWLATRGDGVPTGRRRVPLVWLLKRYNPGPVLVVGVAMGFGLGLASIFLRPYAASLGISGIGLFFSVYAITAFVTRLSIRRLPERIGIRAMLLFGIGCLAVDMLLYLPVRAAWHFVLPATVVGIAHAILFPAVVAGGSSVFPDRYRGLATALMLATFDLGMFIGSPTIGSILRVCELVGLPRYPTMFTTLALLFTLVGIWYALATRWQPSGAPRRALSRGERIESTAAIERVVISNR